jgi:hypothetical protein
MGFHLHATRIVDRAGSTVSLPDVSLPALRWPAVRGADLPRTTVFIAGVFAATVFVAADFVTADFTAREVLVALVPEACDRETGDTAVDTEDLDLVLFVIGLRL